MVKALLISLGLSSLLGVPALAQALPFPTAGAVNPTAAIAFDEIDIVAFGQYGTKPGDFASDLSALQAAMANAKPTTVTIPIKTLKHVAYLNGASRIETPAMHTIVITKPGEIDTLDTEKKTYRRVTGDAVKTLPLGSGGTAFPVIPPGMNADPKPGTLDLSMDLDTNTIDPATIGGQAASGYRTTIDAKTQSTGSCTSIGQFMNMRVTMDTYVIDRDEPAPSQANPLAQLGMGDLTKLPFFNGKGCAFDGMSYQAHHLTNMLALGKFAIFRSMQLTMNSTSGTGFSPTIVWERGNLRTLTSADAALFDVPSDYTLVQ